MRPKFMQETADLVTFTEEIRNGKLHCLFNVVCTIAKIECLSCSFFFLTIVGILKSFECFLKSEEHTRDGEI